LRTRYGEIREIPPECSGYGWCQQVARIALLERAMTGKVFFAPEWDAGYPAQCGHLRGERSIGLPSGSVHNVAAVML
jgi:hypothetical protein